MTSWTGCSGPSRRSSRWIPCARRRSRSRRDGCGWVTRVRRTPRSRRSRSSAREAARRHASRARVSFTYERVPSAGAARAGVFTTPHGAVHTPAFMAVGTLATVKALDPIELRAIGCEMILANTYHLHLRPGDEIVRSLGGVHRFMAWDGPMLTDSGGFQVFSLESLRTVTEDGVEFRSHIDGSKHQFTPESVMRIERNLCADVIMQFDHVIPGQSEDTAARDASERSIRWLARCLTAFTGLPPVHGRQ